MNKSNRILKVPEQSFVRNTLRIETRLLVEKENLLPPASFEVMEELAIGLLKKLAISEDYTNFTIVLLGNESWRKTVEATPFNRRLLLLPQCLKNNTSCKGQFDELGLNCAACKACPIDDILLKAEKLGYATLVAEGTTVAVGLVEEGAIDAVIGVSCMPVLQRSFEPVSNAAVPVIGLPLMYDGCENTKIDQKWLLEELTIHNLDLLHEPISTSGLKGNIKAFFANGSLDHYFAEDRTDVLAKEFVQVGGERMRPLLAALAYKAYANDVQDDILFRLSLIIECFHKASLIHDDIEDDADFRYDKETAHKKYGIPQAINAGDFLIGKGYRLLTELGVSGEVLAKGLKQVSDSHLKLTQGQGNDILFNSGEQVFNVEQTLEVFKNKTGEAIKVALLLGAIVGEAKDQELKTLADFSDLMGIAYQIRDDLNEFNEKSEAEKIADYPFLLALVSEKGISSFQDVVEFRRVIQENKLDQKAGDILGDFVKQCYAKLDELHNAKLRLSLYGVLGRIFKPVGNYE